MKPDLSRKFQPDLFQSAFKLNPVASGMQPGRNYSRQKLGILGAAACLIPYRLLAGGVGSLLVYGPGDPLHRFFPMPDASAVLRLDKCRRIHGADV